jgi:RNA polymerase sigma factor for flagellar operon FliA
MDTVSRHTRRASRDLTRAIKDLTRRLGRPPEETEIAQALGLDPAAYQAMLLRITEAGMTRLELLDFDQVESDAGGRTVDDEVSQRELAGAVADAVEDLPARLQQVLALYYQEECSLREIGAILGVSESRVSQLHTEAVHRLRAAIGGE